MDAGIVPLKLFSSKFLFYLKKKKKHINNF